MIRANIGSGVEPAAGWDNFDVLGGGRGLAMQWDVRRRLRSRWDFYDYAVAHHVLGALDHHELPAALTNIREILKPGGVLRISVPDLESGFANWRAGNHAWFPQDDQIIDIESRFCTWATWFGTHRSVFTRGYLAGLLQGAGFEAVRQTDAGWTHSEHFDITALDSRPTESMFVEATKPG